MIDLKDCNQLKEWLNKLVKERISSEIDINLIYDKEIYWQLTSLKYDKRIKIILNKKLYKVGYQNNIKCSYLNIKNNFFESQFDYLPAPASEELIGELLKQKCNFFTINYDILGLSFWMLNRCEEIYPKKKLLDKYERFNGRYAHSIINDYHLRPIVDEWFLFLCEVITYYFPEVKIIKTKFRILPSIDIDNPRKFSLLYKRRIIFNYLKTFFKDISFGNLKYLLLIITKRIKEDPYDSFEWILNQNKSMNIQAEYYFMVNHDNWRHDTGYDINHPFMRNLLKKIHLEGNIIGLHPSYDSIKSNNSISYQFQKIRNLCSELSINQEIWCARMHYLRFIFPETAYQYEEAGIKYDSSLYFDDNPGFRCGTCKPYNLFDPINNKILDLIERPVIFMDDSLISHQPDNSEGLYEYINKIDFLKNQCKNVSGDFIFIWHNCKLTKEYMKLIYSRTLKY